MSARHIKKRLETKQSQLREGSPSNDHLHEEDEANQSNARSTVFTLINPDSSDSDHDSDAQPAVTTSSTPHATATANEPQPLSKSAKKRINKKKNKAAATTTRDDEDEFLDAQLGSSTTPTPSSQPTQTSSLAFSVDCLNPDAEIKRKLKVNTLVGTNAKTAKRFHLTLKDPEWPAPPVFASGMGAHMIQLADGSFTYEAGDVYKAAQQHYQALVMTFDHQLIQQMLQTNPYHVDALLLMYDVLVTHQQNEAALRCLRMALYAMESWFSPKFSKLMGGATTPPTIHLPRGLANDSGDDCGLNGALLRGLSLAMRLAGRRDCFETAWSLAKFILSLHASDPTYTMLCVDYYAIRAGQFEWLAKFDLLPTSVLPNAAFSDALALFCTSSPDADKNMQLAIRRFPPFCKAVAPGCDFGVGNEWLARNSLLVQHDGIMEKLIRLVMERLSNVWQGEYLEFMVRNVKTVARENASVMRDDSESQIRARYASALLTDFSDSVSIIPRDEQGDDVGGAQQVQEPNHEEQLGPGVVDNLIDYMAQMLGRLTGAARGEQGNAQQQQQQQQAQHGEDWD